jgi:hypothetical protein
MIKKNNLEKKRIDINLPIEILNIILCYGTSIKTCDKFLVLSKKINEYYSKYCYKMLFNSTKGIIYKKINNYKFMIIDQNGVNEIRKYRLHDNGGRLREIHVYRDCKKIKIYSREGAYRGDIFYKTPELNFNYVDIFIDVSVKPLLLGNSILVMIDKNKYIYIGWKTYKFTFDDPILMFCNRIGNNNVSYSYAISEEYVILLDNKQYILKTDIKYEDQSLCSFNVYYQYYGHTSDIISNKYDLKYDDIGPRL